MAAGKPPSDLLRSIPQVEKLLSSPEFRPLIETHSRQVVTRIVREDLDTLRAQAGNGGVDAGELEPAAIRDRVARKLKAHSVPYYRPVINATGVVLHTGLGRAPLGRDAVRALAEAAGGAIRVEIDLETGDRGGREEGCARLLRRITGAEGAAIVNNNAAATLLILAALARGKKVLLSRGEMVEIGGSYRVPEIMAESGARLVDIGTTNRTHPRDYERALDEESGMILKVHTSNYRIEGFTREVDIGELAEIGHRAGIPVVHDMGSGCFFDLSRHGCPHEPLVQDSLKAGADLVCFSGDKILGGPQAGIILGRRELVDRCRRHPLYRALRCDRLTYLALETTLRVYEEGQEAARERIPALSRLLASAQELEPRARALAKRLADIPALDVEAVADSSQAGSGSLPARELPTWCVKLQPREVSPQELARVLRTGVPAILGRVHDDALFFDLRTVADDELDAIEERLREALVGAE